MKDAPPSAFDAWIGQFIEHIVNVDRASWDVFDRWQAINAVLDAGILAFEADVLIRKNNLLMEEEKSSDLVPIEEAQG